MGKVCMSSKVVRSEGLGCKREYSMCVGKYTGNCVQYFLTVVMFTVCTGCVVRCIVCIVVSCVVCIVSCLVCFVVSCVVCIVVVVLCVLL